MRREALLARSLALLLALALSESRKRAGRSEAGRAIRVGRWRRSAPGTVDLAARGAGRDDSGPGDEAGGRGDSIRRCPSRDAARAAGLGPARGPGRGAVSAQLDLPGAARHARLGFAGLGDSNGSIPPDTHGAVGPTKVMTTLNTQVLVQDRAGA